MTSPVVRYGRLRARVLWNMLTRSGVPVPLSFASAAVGVLFTWRFADLIAQVVARMHDAGSASFSNGLGLLFFVCQLLFSFVVLGSVSIRMFDPRRLAEIDVFSALPLRRLDRFLIQVSDVAFLPVAIAGGVIVPSMALAAWRAGLGIGASAALVAMSAMICVQPVPALVGGYAFVLRAAPGRLLRSRGLLFLAFAFLVAPLVPLLLTIVWAFQVHAGPPGWMPAAWAADAIAAADAGAWSRAAILSGAIVLLTMLVCLFAYVAYDLAFLEHLDEILAKLTVSLPDDSDAVSGRARRTVRAPGLADRTRAALFRKEILGYWRDPALQLTISGLGATAAIFAFLPVGFLGPLATAGVAFVAVYTAACLGLASFSVEGRGLPVLAPLPLAVDEVLRAKLVVNTAVLALAGSIGGGAVGMALGGGLPGGLLFVVPAAIAGLVVSAPLGGLVTAMGALFPRRLQRTGRREISPLAMSFFSALTLLFYASSVAAIAAPFALGFDYAWMPLVVLAAWATVAASLVAAARRAIRAGRSEG